MKKRACTDTHYPGPEAMTTTATDRHWQHVYAASLSLRLHWARARQRDSSETAEISEGVMLVLFAVVCIGQGSAGLLFCCAVFRGRPSYYSTL
jgi:hypothetical protein